jgi:hypothetical protein
MWKYVGEKWPVNLAWRCWLPPSILGSFTCSKSTTWDPQLYFPSLGRRAGDFFPLKNLRLRPGLNTRNLVLKASTLPLDHWSRDGVVNPSHKLHKNRRKNLCWTVCRLSLRMLIFYGKIRRDKNLTSSEIISLNTPDPFLYPNYFPEQNVGK